MSVRPHHRAFPSAPSAPQSASGRSGRSGPSGAPGTAGAPAATTGSVASVASVATADSASDVVRWAAFSCVLVPVVLVVFGTSVGGAAVPALGLVAVTAVCRLLLRRSEQSRRAQRTAGNTRPQGAHMGARTRGGSTPGD